MWAAENGHDAADLRSRDRLTARWMRETGYQPPRPGRFKQFIARVRAWLRAHGWSDRHLTDDDLAALLAAAARKSMGDFDAKAGRSEGARASNVHQVAKLDHSRYRENTMLSGDAEIAVIEVPSKFYTVSEAESVLADRIRQGAGKIEVTNVDQDMPIQIQTHDSLDEAASERAITESTADGTPAKVHAAALLNIEVLLRQAKLGLSHRDWHTYAKNQRNGANKETALQIHRFFAAMKYGDDLYGVKMTVREKRSGKTVFYTLETHDLDVQKIAPETQGLRGGVAKAALPVQSPKIEFSTFFEKFKPLDDLLGFKYKELYPDVRFSISPVYTGSAADYDAPSLHYVGSGEGEQVYGWGLYGSSSENVARWYAEADAERKNRDRISFQGEELDSDWYVKALEKSPEYRLRSSVLQDILDRHGSISGTFTFYRIWISKDPSVEKKIEWLEKNKDDISFQKAEDRLAGSRHLYEQTFWPGKQENLLDWDKAVPKEQARQIEDALPDDIRRDYHFDFAEQGSNVYQQLVFALGSPQAASEFLYRAGIDGITYIGDSSGVRNYVAFSDQDIRIDEHVLFSINSEKFDDMTAIIRPFVGDVMVHTDEQYREYFAGKGIDVTADEARVFALAAYKLNTAEKNRRLRKIKRDWVYEVFTEEEIKKTSRPVADTGMQTRSGGPSDLYRNILREVLNVRRETAWNFAMRMWKRASDEPRQSSLLKDRASGFPALWKNTNL